MLSDKDDTFLENKYRDGYSFKYLIEGLSIKSILGKNTAILYFSPKYPAMKVSYLVAIGVVVLFGLLFVLDYLHTSAPESKMPDSKQTPVSTQSDSLAPIHKGNIIKNGNSTRDVFEALADDDKPNADDMKP